MPAGRVLGNLIRAAAAERPAPGREHGVSATTTLGLIRTSGPILSTGTQDGGRQEVAALVERAASVGRDLGVRFLIADGHQELMDRASVAAEAWSCWCRVF